MTGLTGAAPVIDTLEASLYRHHYPITPEFDIVTLLDQLRTFPPTELGGNEWEAVIAAKSTKLRTLRLLEFLTERQSLGLGLCREDFLQVLDEVGYYVVG